LAKTNDADILCGCYTNSQQKVESCKCSNTSKRDCVVEDSEHLEEKGKISEQESDKPTTEELAKIIIGKDKLIEDYKGRWLRAKADYDNYSKRTQKEIREIHMYAAEEFVKDLLPVMDNFERALDSVEDKSGARDEDADGIINYAREIEGVEVALLLKEKANSMVKIGFRSNDWVDVSTIAKEYNGGGHARASGCSLNAPLIDAKNLVINSISQYMLRYSK
jgi:molecular chaperone GrpE (heat shock protein)